MTAQSSEKLLYNGETYWMSSEPLQPYIANLSIEPILNAPSTALWRGYIGTWEINENKLYLIDLICYGENYEEKSMDYLFSSNGKQFAEWFSGNLFIPDGEMLKYVHAAYASIYERTIILEIKSGVLISQKSITNTLPDHDPDDDLPF